MAFTPGATDIRNYFPELKDGVLIPAITSSWGSQTIVLSGVSGAPSTTPITLTTAPVAATVKYMLVISATNIPAQWDVYSSTNTKASVVFSAQNSGSSLIVVGSTSVLNVGLAAGEVLKFNTSSVANASATIVVGIETAN